MIRLFILSSLVLLTVLSGSGVAFADSGTATDLFVGTATTGVGQPLPLEIDPSNVTVRNDGAIGLGYTYRAIGTARGRLPGNFTYEEHGYLFFGNPADPSTFVGSNLLSAVFTLTPNRQSRVVRIVDTDPAAYRSGTETVKVSQLSPDVRRSLDQLSAAFREPSSHAGSVTYGYFTFTDNQVTFTGYSTPDSRQFAIRITFGVGNENIESRR